MSDALEGMPCGEIAIGEIVRPDGSRRRLCEHHYGFSARDRDDGWTIVRYAILDRGGVACEQILREGETVPKREPLCGVCGLGLGVMLDYQPPMSIICPRCQQWEEHTYKVADT